MDNDNKIVTRFAPSPTGFMHLGHAFAALHAWHLAREQNGKFLLRIENIDTGRCRQEFEEAIFKTFYGWDLTGMDKHESNHKICTSTSAP